MHMCAHTNTHTTVKMEPPEKGKKKSCNHINFYLIKLKFNGRIGWKSQGDPLEYQEKEKDIKLRRRDKT